MTGTNMRKLWSVWWSQQGIGDGNSGRTRCISATANCASWESSWLRTAVVPTPTKSIPCSLCASLATSPNSNRSSVSRNGLRNIFPVAPGERLTSARLALKQPRLPLRWNGPPLPSKNSNTSKTPCALLAHCPFTISKPFVFSTRMLARREDVALLYNFNRTGRKR